jgi:putative peptidoglycan lipid II flippase
VSEGSTLGRASLVVAGGILLSRILGFLRDVVLLGLLGRSAEADLFQQAFFIPDYLFFLMAGGYLSITLVPILARHLAAGDLLEARRALTAVARIVGMAMLVATAALLAFADPVTRFLFPEVDAGSIPRLVGLTRIGVSAQLFFVLGAVFSAAQYANRRFVIPTLAPIIYNLAIIAGGAASALAGDPSPEGFLWGALAGAFAGNFALQVWGANRVGMAPTAAVRLSHPAVREYFTMAIPLMVGQSAVALDEQFPRLFGQLAEAGDTAGLIAARKLNMLPVGVIAQAAGVAAYPFLASLAAEGRRDELRRTVLVSASTSLAVAGLAAGLVVALARPLVRLAYQYGRFGEDDTAAVAGFLVLYALSIPFWATHQVFTRAFYAHRRMWLPVGIGTAVTLVAIPVFVVAARGLGASGIALASTISVGLYAVAIAVAWFRAEPGDLRPFLLTVARVAVMSSFAGLAALALAAGLASLDVPVIVRTPAAAALGSAVYLGLARLLGLRELDPLLRRLRLAGR